MEEIEKHCKSFYIRTNRCSSLYNDIFALRGWKTEEINGIEFELNSILVEKWKGKAYRLVIQRQKRMDGVQDLWEGEYTYRCILTNDYDSSVREIVEFFFLMIRQPPRSTRKESSAASLRTFCRSLRTSS